MTEGIRGVFKSRPMMSSLLFSAGGPISNIAAGLLSRTSCSSRCRMYGQIRQTTTIGRQADRQAVVRTREGKE